MKGNDTKERLLRIGLDQMSVAGLSGVTLGQLASASGISKSGLFAHFRSKEQLQIELLDEMAQAADRVVAQPAMQAAEGLPRLIALMENWLDWSGRAGLSGGCPVAAALFELDDVEGEVRSHAAKLEEHWREQLRQFVMEARWMGHLCVRTDVEQFVWELCGIYLSHHVSSRFLRYEDAAGRAKTAFDALVRRHGGSV
ncbi:TetR/AcrR family transcriptional regulator [Mesorhizobium sp. CO1-1-8]|uniref:TetR/AcrR family transcriptional regulator n=1 Tax=Mesorhizobium sp. CO1-1-8 TaxID=2876631 RepID=UPI001CD1478A|nr:TetR/AcrR family transcriptional regulator [Mesorhizobium sp. CO1-1-8]MBZ9772589.1 TetR/AcrR family transcriptional regulator [Mesorhizobium sp. CO1-1-8]